MPTRRRGVDEYMRMEDKPPSYWLRGLVALTVLKGPYKMEYRLHLIEFESSNLPGNMNSGLELYSKAKFKVK